MVQQTIDNSETGLSVRGKLNTMFGEIYAFTKATFGLSNVDNTSDAAKPISTATATALNLKAPLSSPALTGTPTAPTPANATNNTQLATTAFVQALIAGVIASAPGALDTLDELAAAFGDDPNFAATMTTALSGKQPLDATLTAMAALPGGADKLPYFTAADVLAQADLSATGRAIIAMTNYAALKSAMTISSGDVTDWTEAVQDVVGALVIAAGGTYNDAANSIAFPAGSDPWTWLKLAADSTVSLITFVNVTGMVFAADANSTYRVELLGSYQAAATTTGIALALDIPAGAEIIGINITAVSATALGGTEQIADATTTGATTGVRAVSTNTPVKFEAIVRINATAGNVQLMQRSEIAASNTVLKATITAMGYRKI